MFVGLSSLVSILGNTANDNGQDVRQVSAGIRAVDTTGLMVAGNRTMSNPIGLRIGSITATPGACAGTLSENFARGNWIWDLDWADYPKGNLTFSGNTCGSANPSKVIRACR